MTGRTHHGVVHFGMVTLQGVDIIFLKDDPGLTSLMKSMRSGQWFGRFYVVLGIEAEEKSGGSMAFTTGYTCR